MIPSSYKIVFICYLKHSKSPIRPQDQCCCHLLNSVPWHLLTDRDQAANELRKSRIRDLTSYIDEHYTSSFGACRTGKTVGMLSLSLFQR